LQEDSKDKAAHQIQLDHDGLRRGAGIWQNYICKLQNYSCKLQQYSCKLKSTVVN
jgi:hypothetical protein